MYATILDNNMLGVGEGAVIRITVGNSSIILYKQNYLYNQRHYPNHVSFRYFIGQIIRHVT